MPRGATIQDMRAEAFGTPQSPASPETGVAETPQPDYDDTEADESGELRENRRKSFQFVNNFKNVISNIRTIEDLYTCFPEPDPDYLNDDNDDEEGKTFHPPDAAADFPPPPPPCSAEELSAAVAEAYSAQHSNGIAPTADGLSPADAPLIKPKPLVNPCLESRERQALHRELLMNYKIGKDVLKKPELDKVMRDRREVQRKKEWDEQKSNKGRTSLEIKLEERANRMKEEEEKKMKVIVEESQTPELVRIQRKILKSSGTGEQS
ncbi:uncharacterized protein LOC106052374 isoform X1 [Biomphalaria glabrata]|uniref:Uncharacterized protein LOC106052374 isoform X1 n=1 Tax=Biomphalaria glabrata TaxID=6526 RepID=A0A9W3A8G1_BIOGL|nr:uncharacterized protein LOC106052374 isoform X1 [Biomphalaria glabrata]XP_055883448.1 uncharacterized protein LOC106052374 isoform X1 [Biomphalaria glabrata]XP_055883449.1 uncharacterized protein LOC106052374 isoform X1 [Biomphalaria glabrata]XP_055883450.1 uncharacterized protein LOC106052374 isoform X1 [Biomphalaria glabrata]